MDRPALGWQGWQVLTQKRSPTETVYDWENSTGRHQEDDVLNDGTCESRIPALSSHLEDVDDIVKCLKQYIDRCSRRPLGVSLCKFTHCVFSMQLGRSYHRLQLIQDFLFTIFMYYLRLKGKKRGQKKKKVMPRPRFKLKSCKHGKADRTDHRQSSQSSHIYHTSYQLDYPGFH